MRAHFVAETAAHGETRVVTHGQGDITRNGEKAPPSPAEPDRGGAAGTSFPSRRGTTSVAAIVR